MTKILMVDDDVEFCQLIREFLEPEGFDLTLVHLGQAALLRIQKESFDLMLLDVMMPELSGLEVLKRVQMASNMPVVMLTARGEEMDRIIGLEIGADDYIPKSSHPRELLARIRSVLRRSQPQMIAESSVLQCGDLVLDQDKCEVHWHNAPVDLTQTELQLLQYLMERGGKVVSKQEMSEVVLKRPLEVFDRTLDVHISRIRRKLKAKGAGQLIKTVRGFGFMLEGKHGA